MLSKWWVSKKLLNCNQCSQVIARPKKVVPSGEPPFCIIKIVLVRNYKFVKDFPKTTNAPNMV
jgi:hypothetical protein